MLIVMRFRYNRKTSKINKTFIEQFFLFSSLAEVEQFTQSNPASAAKVVMHAFKAQDRFSQFQNKSNQSEDKHSKDEFLTRVIRQTLSNESNRFDQGSTTLASIGATAFY